MKSIRYIIAISTLVMLSVLRGNACGPYYPANPTHLCIFRSCSPELERQWQEGCRFQDYEKDENCLLWQKITSSAIPLKDIEKVVYDAGLKDIQDYPEGKLSDNKFAFWIFSHNHKDDLEYLLIAKEIEEIREYMNNPWYYPYDGDEEHIRLAELEEICHSYAAKRHASRYALQSVRLYFSQNKFEDCITLWESRVSKMPKDIVTDMIASYVGGAYFRKDNRNKAIELFTRSGDIGSLINLKAWADAEKESGYTDPRIKEMEYIFNRFPNSPLLSVKLQEYVRNREVFVYNYEDWKDRNFHDPVGVKFKYVGDSIVADDEPTFYNELKHFAKTVITNKDCHQKGMWHYALACLYHLDGNNKLADQYITKAQHSETSLFIKESIEAFRFLLDAKQANNSATYQSNLMKQMKWLDNVLQRDIKLSAESDWQSDNKMNWSFYYWQDVARKILLGEVCPRLEKAGNTTLALQLANYATNRCYQLSPLYAAYHYGGCYEHDSEYYMNIIPFEEYRKEWPQKNYFDYQSQFFELIDGVSADQAARYASRIYSPQSESDRWLNKCGYTDNDYVCDIVGTLYLREMNYAKAVEWLVKVSSAYQARTNIDKEGYFKLDPFLYQHDKKHLIADSSDYKLRFAQEMARLETLMELNIDANRKANAKIRYATGLRNSFGHCWYLTQYEYSLGHDPGDDWRSWRWYSSSKREGFKDNKHAQNAYEKVDMLMADAVNEFTDREQAAQALLEMKNFKTVIRQYPNTRAAAFVRGHCDSYNDYALQRM